MKVISVLLFLLIISFIININPEKQKRIDACVKIMDAKLEAEKEFTESLFSYFNKENIANKLLTMSVLSCYIKLQSNEADEILQNQIDSSNEKYKKLIDIEKWVALAKDANEEKLNKEASNLIEATQDIQTGEITLQKQNEHQKEQFEQYLNYKQELKYKTMKSKEREIDFNFMGIKFSKLSRGSKNMIGFVFFLFVIILLGIGLKKIMSMKKENKTGKKKKKEKKTQ